MRDKNKGQQAAAVGLSAVAAMEVSRAVWELSILMCVLVEPAVMVVLVGTRKVT